MLVKRDQVGHAYIIEGETGLLESANAFAKALNCLEEGEAACNGCISCRVFDSGNHPDTLYITGTKAAGIGVDDVREQIILQMATKPFSYKYKIFIVDKAETLTPAAQNALLKTIEEPAPFGVFLLLTAQIQNLLPTVLSRCVVVKNRAEFTQPDYEPDEAMQALTREIIKTAHGLDILQAMALYKKIEPFKESKESVRALLDMLYVGYGLQIRLTQNPRDFAAIEAVVHTKQILAQNGNFQLAMELMLLKISGAIAPTSKVGAVV
jgi:DNA polymerase III delta prime subunit